MIFEAENLVAGEYILSCDTDFNSDTEPLFTSRAIAVENTLTFNCNTSTKRFKSEVTGENQRVFIARSEERRVGKECLSTCTSRCSATCVDI